MTITAVCGFGRCGSSLVMQMLEAAGYGVMGDYPIFEHNPDDEDTPSESTLLASEGKAIKVLNPHLVDFPTRHNYRFIWIDRNVKEQAKSFAKFTEALAGIRVTRQKRFQLQYNFKNDRPLCLTKMKELGPVLILDFETILTFPGQQAEKVAEFVGLRDDVAADMSAVVEKRSPRCHPAFLELELFERKKNSFVQNNE